MSILSAAGIPSVTVLTADEQLMVDTINQERIAAGVNPVQVDLRLASVGRAKANDMKANNYFSPILSMYKMENIIYLTPEKYFSGLPRTTLIL